MCGCPIVDIRYLSREILTSSQYGAPHANACQKHRITFTKAHDRQSLQYTGKYFSSSQANAQQRRLNGCVCVCWGGGGAPPTGLDWGFAVVMIGMDQRATEPFPHAQPFDLTDVTRSQHRPEQRDRTRGTLTAHSLFSLRFTANTTRAVPWCNVAGDIEW